MAQPELQQHLYPDDEAWSTPSHQLSKLELAVLDKLCEGTSKKLAVLREQARQMEVVERTLTGVGFLTQLRVAATAPRLEDSRSLRVGDVVADIVGLDCGAGFLVYIDEGYITAMEGYSFHGPWPQSEDQFSVRFARSERDLGDLDDTLREMPDTHTEKQEMPQQEMPEMPDTHTEAPEPRT